ncbi:MAG TPA: CBS domain-containing protein, partial [Firmicutes bacterium]|nr:CBS domain-containing protein [Bacillota bacterium]
AVTVTVAPDVPLNQAATKLTAGGLNLVPVVSPDGRLQGVLTRASLVGVLVESWNGNGHLPESREAVAAGGGAQ